MRYRKFVFVFVMAAFLLSAASAPAFAGWIEEDRETGTVYISGPLIKSVPPRSGGMWSVMDLKKGTITMVNTQGRSYTVIYPARFCAEMKSMMGNMMQGMPPEQRAMMEQMMNAPGGAQAPKVSVQRKGPGGKVAGYHTVKYSVTVNGRPYKDIWLAPGAPIMNDMRQYTKKSTEMSAQMEACTKMAPGMALGPAPEASPEYLSLAPKGWPMKEVDKRTSKVDKEVIRLERSDIPSSTFSVPAGYRKVSMREMMMGGGPR
jgi:hypothetical protein